jgi:ABC-2 type transport system permease protein
VTRLVRAELLKLTTTRLVLWLLLLLLGLELLVISLTASQNSLTDLVQPSSQRDLLAVSSTAALLSLILGIVAAGGEYDHGTVSHTFLVAPVRERVVAAKAVAAALLGVGLAVLGGLSALALSALWLSGRGVPSHLLEHDSVSLLLGTLLASALTGALGVGFGSLLRRQTAAIVLTFVWLLVAEPLLGIAGVQKFAPGHAVAAVVEGGQQSGELLGFGAGLLVVLAYVAAVGLLGTLAVKGSDVS